MKIEIIKSATDTTVIQSFTTWSDFNLYSENNPELDASQVVFYNNKFPDGYCFYGFDEIEQMEYNYPCKKASRTTNRQFEYETSVASSKMTTEQAIAIINEDKARYNAKYNTVIDINDLL